MSDSPTPRKFRAYDLMEQTSTAGSQPPPDPIEQLQQVRRQDIADKAMEARGKAIIAEYERDERESRSKSRSIPVDDGTGFETVHRQPAPPAPMSPAANILGALTQGGMSPEKALETVRGLAPEDIAKMNMFTSGPRQGGMDPTMAMMLLGKLGSQPQITVADMLSIGPKFVESARAMAEISKPSEGGNQLVGLLTEMVKQAGADRQNALDAKIDVLKQQLTGSDPVGTTTTLSKNLKESGLIAERAGGDTKSAEIDLKIEEMRTDREFKMMQMRFDMQKYNTEKNAEQERWSSILQTAPAALAMFAPAISDAARAPARKADGAPPQQVVSAPAQTAPGTAESAGEAMTLACTQCNTQFVVRSPYPAEIVCPNCAHRARFPTV